MLDYNELYEYVRKEKYGEQLQPLSKQFVNDVGEFFEIRRRQMSQSSEMFSEDALREKKQFENALAIFRELIRIRKKKILNLVFVASETGIMKRDFGTMLDFEQELFEKLVGAIGDADKALQNSLHGRTSNSSGAHKMILVNYPIAEFVDMNGNSIGPFDKGILVNLDTKVADILVSEGKATLVDEG